MTDEADNSRWNDLAKQLGLDGPPTPAPQPRERPQTDDSGVDSEIPESVAAGEPSLGSEGENDKPDRQKRRRGKRGGRRRKNGNGDEPSDAAERNVDNGQTPERGPRRRKGRRRDEGADDDAANATAAAAEPAHESDDEEIESLSDWNVPTWTELIDSLYRPDR